MVGKCLTQCFAGRHYLSAPSKWAGDGSLRKRANCDTFQSTYAAQGKPNCVQSRLNFRTKHFNFCVFWSYFLISFFFLFFKIWNASRICMSSLRRGHANLLCIIPILVYVLPKRALLLSLLSHALQCFCQTFYFHIYFKPHGSFALFRLQEINYVLI